MTTNQKTVLIVDDDNDIRDSMQMMVRHLGYEAKAAEDGGAGLREIRWKKPDAILLDLMMPNINGFEFMQKLEAMNISVPIIIVTAFADGTNTDKVRSCLHVQAILKKPIRLMELKETLERIFQTAPA